jgi:Holliday junction DNA helicase RuvB
MLTSPMRDRFGVSLRMDFYSADQLKLILLRSAQILGVVVGDDAAHEIARRSRGTPRIANRLLKRVRDYAQEKSDGVVSLAVAKESLHFLEIDESGLDNMDRYILETIVDKFGGGPVGIETIAVAVGEERETIEDVYEPFLIQEGLIARTRRGREVTDRGYQQIGRVFPVGKQMAFKIGDN